MIGIGGDDYALIAAGQSRDAQGQIVGFAAGAVKDNAVDLLGKGADQTFRIVDEPGFEIARIGADPARLLRHRGIHLGVAVTQRGDVVVEIEVGPAVGIIEPHAFATNEVDRLAILQPVRGSQDGASARDQPGLPRRQFDFAGPEAVGHEIGGHVLPLVQGH